MPVTPEEKPFSPATVKVTVERPEPWGNWGREAAGGRLREKRVGGLCLPSQPSGKLSPPRLRHQRPLTFAHLDSCVTFTPLPSTSNLPPAQILALKNLKLRVLLPYTVSLSHIQSPLSCVTAKGDVTSLWLRPPSPFANRAPQQTLN